MTYTCLSRFLADVTHVAVSDVTHFQRSFEQSIPEENGNKLKHSVYSAITCHLGQINDFRKPGLSGGRHKFAGWSKNLTMSMPRM